MTNWSAKYIRPGHYDCPPLESLVQRYMRYVCCPSPTRLRTHGLERELEPVPVRLLLAPAAEPIKASMRFSEVSQEQPSALWLARRFRSFSSSFSAANSSIRDRAAETVERVSSD